MVQPESSQTPMTKRMRTAWQCAWIPLILGTAVYLLWLLTRWEAMMLLGLLVIALGVLLTGVCLVALITDILKERASKVAKNPRAMIPRVLCILLMAANYPIAMWMIGEGNRFLDLYPVTIQNTSFNA